jgi:CBS domain-containing protein
MMPKARDRLVTVGGHAPLTKAAELLFEPCCRMVVVCDAQGAMIGVVTRTDIIRQIRYCQGCACTTPSIAVMTRNAIFCRPDDRLDDTWTVMKERGLHSVPVIDSARKPIGLLSARDVLEALLDSVEYQEHLLKDYVTCTGYR